VGGFEGRRIATTWLRVTLASLVVCGAGALALAALGERWHRGFAIEALTVLASFALSAAALFLMMRALRVTELETVTGLVASLRARFLGGGAKGGA
jgi:hypothetical protein